MTRRRQPIGRRLRPLRVGGVGIFAVFLSACIEDAPLDSLDPQGPFARRIDDLLFWIAVGIFVLVQAALVVAVVVFRDRGETPEPRQVHGSPKLEVVWTIIPALILAAVAVP
ncbi:MAG: cytochrome c oxidase subunit II transmembrane domain-containing protein, partial [Acidimicrobiia bacterium]